MKFLILCLFFAVLLKYSISQKPQKGEKAESDDDTAGEIPSQTKDNGTGLMSNILKKTTIALALQSPFITGSAIRLSSSSTSESTDVQNVYQYQTFMPNVPENAVKIPAFKELHANPLGNSIEVAKHGQMENEMVHFHEQRKLSTKSSVAEGKFDPKMRTIDPKFYPQAPRGNVKDTYKSQSGKEVKKVKVPDPYRGLENATANATKQFVEEINNFSQRYLEASPFHQKLKQNLTDMWNYESFFTPEFYGNLFYYHHNSGLQNQRVLYQTKSLNSTGKVFLDPNTLSKDGTTAVTMESFSDDGTVFAYGISEKGSESVTVKFKKSNGKDLPDQLKDLQDTAIEWVSDESKVLGVFYSNYAERSGDELSKHSMFFHKMGTDSKNDILVVPNNDQPNGLTYGQVSEDGRFLFVIKVADDKNTQMLYTDLSEINYNFTGPLKLTPLFDQADADYQMIDSDNKSVLVYTNIDAPQYKLIRVSLKGGTKQTPQVVIPENPKQLLRFVYPVDGDKLLVCYMKDVKSFVSPFTIFYADFAKYEKGEHVQLEVFRQGKVPEMMESKEFTVEQVFYASKDGTPVPMFVAHRTDMKLNGNNPVLLTGYGGFDENILPSFYVDYIMFIQQFGGVVATANIRGGGEYGEKWHEQGMLDKKQNVFDDFIAAAEYLINKKYTKSSKLAIFGASNGGLLTAVCSQQRPDLFGAVITQYGLLDMLRFNKLGIGSDWVSEYGDPDNATDFSYIYKYSPLQQLSVTPGKQWPATLLLSADHDGLVDVSHTLKYTAQLYHLLHTQAESWQRNPVVAKILVDQGHAFTGTPTEKKIKEKVDIYTFIARALELEWTE
ncbi:hypothetical protein niasHT_038833 [Heterodera trifolii]|uniref:Prolyl endopeptidase n=1 Tax=Heterodera trifolii TaxID=157864 RepID=A0ABD2I1U1_9BILA